MTHGNSQPLTAHRDRIAARCIEWRDAVADSILIVGVSLAILACGFAIGLLLAP